MPTAVPATVQANRLARLFVAGALVILAACSVTVTKKLNTGEGEAKIRTFLQSKTDASVQDVNCPDREVKKGDVFECTAILDGQPLRVRVTQDDAKSHATIRLAQAVIIVERAVSIVEQRVQEATGTPVKADCGPHRYLVKDPGATVDCQVTPTSGGTSSRVILTVKDVDGNIDIRLA